MSTQYFINKYKRKVSVHISRRSSICCPSWKRVHRLRLRQIGTTCGGAHEYLIWMRHSKRCFAETDNHLLVTRYLKYQKANTVRTSEDHRMRSYYPTKEAVGVWVFFLLLLWYGIHLWFMMPSNYYANILNILDDSFGRKRKKSWPFFLCGGCIFPFCKCPSFAPSIMVISTCRHMLGRTLSFYKVFVWLLALQVEQKKLKVQKKEEEGNYELNGNGNAQD